MNPKIIKNEIEIIIQTDELEIRFDLLENRVEVKGQSDFNNLLKAIKILKRETRKNIIESLISKESGASYD